KAGLAAPVGSNETKALALAYGEIEIGKEGFMKGKRKILDRNKRHGNQPNSATHKCPVSKPRYASMCWRMSGTVDDRAFRKRQNKTVVSVSFFRPAQITYAGQNRGHTDGDDHDASHTSYSPPFPVYLLKRITRPS